DRRCRRTGRFACRGRAAATPRAVSRPPPKRPALAQLPEEDRTCVTEASRPDLPRTAHAIFEAGQLLDADRTARVKTASGDADLRAKPDLAAVGELRRGVVQHDRGIALAQELPRRGGILAHDRIGVVRAVMLDMTDRGIDAVDHLGGDDGIEIFGRP